MKIKDVVGECLTKMGQTDFSNEQNLDAQKTELKNRLLACINIIYREIVSDYLPLVHTESVSFQDGKIASSTLSKQILYPIKIVQGDEKKVFLRSAGNLLRRDGSGANHVCLYAANRVDFRGGNQRYATYKIRACQRRARRILLPKQNVRPRKKFRLRLQSANRVDAL